MKTKRIIRQPRCAFTDSRGRQCRLFRAEDHESLCRKHALRDKYADEHEPRTPEAKAIVAQVLGSRENFQTATQVNQALGKLFALRARKLISLRDAALLGYLSQLLLFSLNAVRNEFNEIYTSRAWEKIIEDALRHPGLNLPDLPNDVSGSEGGDVGVASSSLAVGAASMPKGKGAGVASSSSSSVRSHEKKKKPRPLPDTGAEFAQQVFEQVAVDRARRKKRTAQRFAEHQQAEEQHEEQQGEQPEEVTDFQYSDP
jgi:hypothetical protein